MIGVENLNVAYDGRYAVLDATFGFVQGRSSVWLALNGAGKSSLIQALMGLIDPENGHVSIDKWRGPNPACGFFAQAAASIGYVPQKQNVAVGFPISVCGMLMAWVNMAS